MKERRQITCFTICLAFTIAIFISSCKQQASQPPHRVKLEVQQTHPLKLSDNKRVAFGWNAIGMAPGDTILLQLNEKLKNKYNWLRITVAQEIWDENLVHAFIPGENILLGTLDIKYSSVLVPYELEIPEKHIPLVNEHGIKLVLESKSPFWFYSASPLKTKENLGLMPHILSSEKASGNMDDFLTCFQSLNSLQAFGWREGTVLDGLWQIYSKTGSQDALNTIKQHLGQYFDNYDNLVYENAGSSPNDNCVDGIESTIPFATLARLQPNHPMLQTVVEGWQHLKKENGMIIDGTMVSAEGCYTVSYPMAVMGKAWNNQELIQEAQAQLKHRFVLIDSGNFYLRYYTNRGYTYQNWARGAAWFLLGFSRTIEEIGTDSVDKEIVTKFKEATDIALSMQREDGLWSCIMHDTLNSLPDASGSAGISAAIATGVHLGILPNTYLNNVKKCYASLQSYITPDGFLKGVAQDNRGGEALQQSDYRVIAQMGMGMMAQLYASTTKDTQETK